MTKRERKAQLRALKSIRGLERKAHFERGGDLTSWRGGTRTVTVDRKVRSEPVEVR